MVEAADESPEERVDKDRVDMVLSEMVYFFLLTLRRMRNGRQKVWIEECLSIQICVNSRDKTLAVTAARTKNTVS